MKNLKDLKPNEAIRVNKAEWPKLAELLDKEACTWTNGHCPTDWSPWNDCKSSSPNKSVLIIGVNEGGIIWKNELDALWQSWIIYPTSEFLQPENGSVIESATKTGHTEQYQIGKSYEFSNSGDDWHKAKLLAIIDHAGKYIVEKEGDDWPLSFMHIRSIQPKEITIKDVAGLLHDWLELWQAEGLIEGSLEYQSTISNLERESYKILQQLKDEGTC